MRHRRGRGHAIPIQLDDAFAHYTKRVLADADPEQIEACRCAFFAGVAFLLGQIEGFVLQTPLQSGREYLTTVRSDCDAFLRQIRLRLRRRLDQDTRSPGEYSC
jgi:hypothetical protein